MTKNIFIFAYYSYYDPVFQSAVLPYFLDFPQKEGFKFILVTFEQEKYKTTKSERSIISKELSAHNIVWQNFTWHSGAFKIVKKAYDFTSAMLICSSIIRRYNINAIYSEGFPGAIFGYHLSKLFKIPHIIHTFEPHADYMIEAGVWKEHSWESRILKYYEKKIALSAAHIMTATDGMIKKIKSWGVKATLHRIPSCVDIQLFKYDNTGRETIRKELGIRSDESLIVYLGKFGGMYMEEEIFDFFKVCNESQDQKFKYLIITPENHLKIKNYFSQNGISPEKFSIKTLQKKEIPRYLSASDFGLVPVRQNLSKRFCSPIKDGEYWACGLPILIFEGISDDYIFTEKHELGIVIKDTQEVSFVDVVKKMSKWTKAEDASLVRNRCRDFVAEDRDVEKYKIIYQQVFLNV